MRPEVALALLVGRGTRDESRSGLRKRDRIALEQSLAKDGSCLGLSDTCPSHVADACKVTDLRAGVEQAPREETAGWVAVVQEGYAAMAIWGCALGPKVVACALEAWQRPMRRSGSALWH